MTELRLYIESFDKGSLHLEIEVSKNGDSKALLTVVDLMVYYTYLSGPAIVLWVETAILIVKKSAND